MSGWGGPIFQVRLRNVDHALNFSERVGFIGQRKDRLVADWSRSSRRRRTTCSCRPTSGPSSSRRVTRARNAMMLSLRKHGGVPRMLASRVFEETLDDRLGRALGYLFERVAANDDGGVQPTYDLSVPENVTYVANGMVSHNTIGLMMDCDTTGIEPDLALVKFKKLVGGGSMQIVNQTVPRALKNLGYPHEQVEAITEYIAEHGHVVNAPGLRPEHYEVFDCAMGERAISPMGHVRMMAAVQPLLSGAISKTVNMPEIGHRRGHRADLLRGLEAGPEGAGDLPRQLQGRPAAVRRQEEARRGRGRAPSPGRPPHEHRPVRKRLPRQRPATVTRFSVAGAEGYMTASSYPDDGVGEVFLKLGKQGSTLAGVMDAFSMAISVGLQYGIPLDSYVAKFTNMRFEPAGLTDDPDIRIASSVMDYIFRRLALDHLPYDERAELGILSAAERAAEVAGHDPAGLGDDPDPEELAQSAAVEQPHHPERAVVPPPAPASPSRSPARSAARPRTAPPS